VETCHDKTHTTGENKSAITFIFVELRVRKYSRTFSGCYHLSSATSFPKYQKFPSEIPIFGTSLV